MASESSALKAGDFDDYDFGDSKAPEGFNPDAGTFERPPVGWHIFTIGLGHGDPEAFSIAETHEFKHKKIEPSGTWVGNQVRPRLIVAEGEHKGKSITDFLPMPTPGTTMPKVLADQWANFIRAFGFRPPEDRLVPPGFKLHSLAGARGMACVKDDTYVDGDGKEVTKRKIDYFGYKPVAEEGEASKPAGTGIQGKRGAAAPKATKSAPPPPATDAVNLDDL